MRISIRHVAEAPEEAIVITHGTGTMGETARFLAGRAASLRTLHPDVHRAVIGAPTALSRIEALSNHVHR